MNKHQRNLFKRFGAGLCLAATLILNLAPIAAVAVDVQTLPNDAAAVHGFTHAARVTFDDLNNADASAVVLQLAPIPTNCYIDRVAFYVDENFTNAAYVATGGATNLVLTIGVGGTTNAFFGSNTLIHARSSLSTNMLVPFRATTSTNYLIACFSDGLQASEVDAYLVGKIRIMWRVVNPSKVKF